MSTWDVVAVRYATLNSTLGALYYRWPDYGDGSSQASGNPIDARQALMCQNLKAATDSGGHSRKSR